ncbi:MAG: hypothetical protein LBL00_04970 [Endomicrobium sp.]|jgi:hypothetical protein|nr:hypothetical protein [Endomicrobium sp.]
MDIEPLQMSVSTNPIRTATTKSPVRKGAATPFKKWELTTTTKYIPAFAGAGLSYRAY